jgi:hypothetical protein
MQTEGAKDMSIYDWVKEKIASLRGDHLDEVMADLKQHSLQTRQRVDEIYDNITLNGENTWGRQDRCDERK